MIEQKKIVITGGAGFVGSSIALSLLQRFEGLAITCLDNLKRRGAELNLPRLRRAGVQFVHGDIRVPEDLGQVGECELIVDCSAEPSVLAGYDTTPLYVVNTNLSGTINCLELARKRGADFAFLSTSRVYPIETINNLRYRETDTRFALDGAQGVAGVSAEGIAEDFPLMGGSRSLYGATKLAGELLIAEYAAAFGVRAIVNRCGILTGPWQMGKVDQGVVVLWMVRHLLKKSLSYIGFGGQGLQVRDMLHVEDLIDLLCMQLGAVDTHNGVVYNVGGGNENAASLCELTERCAAMVGTTIEVKAEPTTRPGDLRYYVTDTRRVREATGWRVQRSVDTILGDIHRWLVDNKDLLVDVLG